MNWWVDGQGKERAPCFLTSVGNGVKCVRSQGTWPQGPLALQFISCVTFSGKFKPSGASSSSSQIRRLGKLISRILPAQKFNDCSGHLLTEVIVYFLYNHAYVKPMAYILLKFAMFQILKWGWRVFRNLT